MFEPVGILYYNTNTVDCDDLYTEWRLLVQDESLQQAVRLDSLFYRPGRGFAIQDVTLEIPVGAVFGFLGANGSGKTTTIRLMLGLLRAARGSIRVMGYEIPRNSPRALAQTGYVPESPHLYAGFSVETAIAYHAGFYPNWDHELATVLRRRMQLPSGRSIRVLSKGEQRKLMMLLALAQRPRLLVLDEPTDGLDPVVRRDILDVLQAAVVESETTVFMSSHLVHELETICDHIAVMDDGKLLVSDRMADFRKRFRKLTVTNAPVERMEWPFTVLRAERDELHGDRVVWFTNGWLDSMATSLAERGVVLHDVSDLDLESGFVELLRSVRPSVDA